MLMWGIWQGKGKPPFNVYFEPFASEMTHLYQQGTVNKVYFLGIIQGTNVCMIVLRARDLLLTFYKDFQSLYGKKF